MLICILSFPPSWASHTDTRSLLTRHRNCFKMFQAEKWPPACILVKILSYPTTQIFLRKVQKVFIWIIHAFVILDLKQSGGFFFWGRGVERTNFLLENVKKKKIICSNMSIIVWIYFLLYYKTIFYYFKVLIWGIIK